VSSGYRLTLPIFSFLRPQVLDEMNDRPYLVASKLNINCLIQTSILNLHKTYQANSYSDPRFSRSLESAISAASWLLRTLNTEVLGSKIDGSASESKHLVFQRYYTPLYVYPAASVLLVHLTQENVAGEEAREVLRDIDRAIGITQRISVSF